MSSGSRSTDDDAAAGPKPATWRDVAERVERLAFFDVGPEDAARLRAWAPQSDANVDRIIEEFYAHLLRFPVLARMLEAEPGRVERLKEKQRHHFASLADGRFDDAYFESRLRVGDAHQRVGLQPAWYIGAYALYLRLAVRALLADAGAADAAPAIESLIKIVFLDMSLAMNTYIHGGFVDREVASGFEHAAQVAEEALAAQAEVERLKDDLTRMVVHDLKNPVSGIAMIVQLAQRKATELPETHLRYLSQIDRTCREMMRLIQNLLEISKIEEGKMPVMHEAVPLPELAEEVVAEYRPIAEQANRVIRVVPDRAFAPALADRALLKRVLINLLVNALRHSGSRDVEIRIAPATEAGCVQLAVTDHGHGIPLEDQSLIFEKFRTVRRSPTDDPATDTGLGLPFCKLAVERMGGTLALASSAEQTVFTVSLPAHVDARE
jgi:signal transduction histidine kinase